jgi:hypothetical protein
VYVDGIAVGTHPGVNVLERMPWAFTVEVIVISAKIRKKRIVLTCWLQ